MSNHFKAGIQALEPDQINALVSPLIALIRCAADEPADPDALTDFADRYEAALGVHGHQLTYMAPNGVVFDADDSSEEGEVVGFRTDDPPWRRMAGSLTMGRIGAQPGPLAARTQSTVISVLSEPPGAFGQRP